MWNTITFFFPYTFVSTTFILVASFNGLNAVVVIIIVFVLIGGAAAATTTTTVNTISINAACFNDTFTVTVTVT